jgi:hypothetical protein
VPNYEKIKVLMKIKIHRKKHKPTADMTVSALNRSVSHSYVQKGKIRIYSLINRLKRFYREYRLPSIATMVFLVLLLSLAAVRQLERTSLLALRNEVSEGGNGYSLLLSADQSDQFSRNDTTENEQPNQSDSQNDSADSNSTQSTSNAFTVIDGSSTTTTSNNTSGTSNNTGSGSTGGSGTSSGSGNNTVPQPDPFTTKIDSFSQGAVSLQCTNTSKPNKGSCSKVYTFTAGIQAINGPGLVSYAWQSNIDTGNGTGSYTAGAGSTLTSVNKAITLICTKNTSFTIQFAILSPVFSNSNTISVNHNCNEI